MGGKGNKEIVKLLLEKNADVTAKTVSGKTAKDLARKQGHDDIAKLLHEHEIQKTGKVIEKPRPEIFLRSAKIDLSALKPKEEATKKVVINEIEISNSGNSIKHFPVLLTILIPFYLIRLN